MNRREALRLVIGGAAGLSALTSRFAESAQAAVPAILRRRIPASGETIPAIGLGTWQTFDVGAAPASRAPLEAVLKAFVDLGGTVIDSSPMYGRSEEVVGDLSAKLSLQSKLFVATKVWTSGKAAGIRQMEDSMRKLRASRIDLMQVHNLLDVGTHLDTLRGWKQEGRVRYVGVTHYTAGSHDQVARVISSQPVDFIQINYSVGEREADKRLLQVAMDRGCAVIVNRPFAGGDLFRRLRSRPLPSWAAEMDCDSWAQILLKFVLAHPAVTCAIPATANVEHLRDNMKAATGRLPDETLRARIAVEAM
jgi:aryl-alcohol dehydrogenase-like predicted oxidoreductase